MTRTEWLMLEPSMTGSHSRLAASTLKNEEPREIATPRTEAPVGQSADVRTDGPRGSASGCDGETIRRAQLGDAAAWETLVRQNIGWIVSTCYRWAGCKIRAEDLTQEVFIRVFQNLHCYRGDLAGFRTWLRRITRNLLIDDYRRHGMERRTVSYDSADERTKCVLQSIPSSESSPEANFANQERKAVLRGAFRLLNPELRRVVVLRDVQGLAYEEISDLLKTPVGTVKSRVNRGRSEVVRFVRQHPELWPGYRSSASAPA
jgi:RNA polymerase sigma-70 factor (ECF subfamily)